MCNSQPLLASYAHITSLSLLTPSGVLQTHMNNLAYRDSQRAAKESAKRFQVNATIATKTAEDFKKMSEDRKAAKKESIDAAKMNKGAGLIVSVHDKASDIAQMRQGVKDAKKESVGKFCFDCCVLGYWTAFLYMLGGREFGCGHDLSPAELTLSLLCTLPCYKKRP